MLDQIGQAFIVLKKISFNEWFSLYKNRVPNTAHDFITSFSQSIPKATWDFLVQSVVILRSYTLQQ